MLAQLVCVVLGLVGLLYLYLKMKWNKWNKFDSLPVIEPTFPVGSFPSFFTKKESFHDGMKVYGNEPNVSTFQNMI